MKKTSISPVWRFLFLVYCAVMAWLLFRRSTGHVTGLSYAALLRQNTNLIPFYTIKNYLYVLKHSASRYMLTHCFINLTGNILLFVPAGWLLPKLWPKIGNYLRFLPLCAGIIFLVEAVQLFTLLGRFDIDDLILNLLGMTVGFLMYTAGKRT